MSVPRPTMESSQSEHESGDSTQNVTTYDRPSTQSTISATPSSPSDSKRSHAAMLARELGSSSPWSETLMPQTYGSLSPSASNSTRLVMRQEHENTNTVTAQAEQDLDPPPAYSRNAPNIPHQIRDTPMEARSSPDTTAAIVQNSGDARASSTDLRQNDNGEHAEPTAETPLIAQPCSTPADGSYSRWRHRRKMKKRWAQRYMCGLLFFCIVVSVLVGFLAGKRHGASWFHRPSTRPGQPVVDTGRIYERHETTSDIYGTYKLWERLVLTTTTGDINIEIDPQPGDDPAILFLSSDIGSVTVRLNDAFFRHRDKAQRTIFTEIHSLTGSICAEILLGHGGYAKIESTTGKQTLHILTSGVGPKDEVSNLTTTSGTGTQKVVLSSLDPERSAVSNIRGLHQSMATASLDIVYSPSWVGKVHAAVSPFGQVSVTGDDLNFAEQELDSIIAYRGSGRNLTLTEVISKGTGNASFRSSKRDAEESVL